VCGARRADLEQDAERRHDRRSSGFPQLARKGHSPMAKEQDTAKAPAVGVSVQFDLGNGRALTLQTHFDQGVLFDPNAAKLVNRLTDLADRQRAKYEIETLEIELAKHVKQRTDMLDDMARVDATFEAESEARDEAVDKIIVLMDDDRAKER